MSASRSTKHSNSGQRTESRRLGEKKAYDRTLRGTEGIVIGATLQNPLPRGLTPNNDGIAEQAL